MRMRRGSRAGCSYASRFIAGALTPRPFLSSTHRNATQRNTANAQPQYVTMDIEAAIEEAGLEYPQQRSSSPRHRTVVAHKPEAAAVRA